MHKNIERRQRQNAIRRALVVKFDVPPKRLGCRKWSRLEDVSRIVVMIELTARGSSVLLFNGFH